MDRWFDFGWASVVPTGRDKKKEPRDILARDEVSGRGKPVSRYGRKAPSPQPRNPLRGEFFYPANPNLHIRGRDRPTWECSGFNVLPRRLSFSRAREDRGGGESRAMRSFADNSNGAALLFVRAVQNSIRAAASQTDGLEGSFFFFFSSRCPIKITKARSVVFTREDRKKNLSLLFQNLK